MRNEGAVAIATDLENLATIRSNYLAALAADSANPRVDYSIEGQSVNRSAWRQDLFDKIAKINDLLASPAFQGAWEIRSRVR